MKKFERLEAVAVPLDMSNVDTDQIVPARYLSRARQDGFGEQCFHDLRFTDDGAVKPDFVLNQAAWESAGILVADETFGCGSSREAAVWALLDYGIQAVIATSFGDIFYNNSFKNGLLPVVLAKEETARLRAALNRAPGSRMAVDLQRQEVTGPDGQTLSFAIDPMRKWLLIEGMDEIGMTLQYSDRLAEFEVSYDRDFPWLSAGSIACQ